MGVDQTNAQLKALLGWAREATGTRRIAAGDDGDDFQVKNDAS